MGFTKLDERILQSSIMAEDATTFKVWITLLAACERNGIAYVSPVYLSSICHIPISRINTSLEKLENPDSNSRSLADEGRRIKRVDGGYEIINYLAYREASLKDAEAERKRLYREERRKCPDTSGRSPDVSASASASYIDKSNNKERTKKVVIGPVKKIVLILDDGPKRWEGITLEMKEFWAKIYPGCDINQVLNEMIAYWDAQPKSKRKINWKVTIVNRLKWLQDHGGTRGNVTGGVREWLAEEKEKEKRGEVE